MINKFKQSSTHAYMQSTLPAFLNRKDETGAGFNESSAEDRLASHRPRKESDAHAKLDLGSPDGYRESVNDNTTMGDGFGGYKTMGGKSILSGST